MTKIKVKVKLFALYREIAGVSEINLTVTSETVVGDVLDIVCERYRLAKYRKYMMVSLNQDYVSEKTRLKNDDEIAILPPVSGG